MCLLALFLSCFLFLSLFFYFLFLPIFFSLRLSSFSFKCVNFLRYSWLLTVVFTIFFLGFCLLSFMACGVFPPLRCQAWTTTEVVDMHPRLQTMRELLAPWKSPPNGLHLRTKARKIQCQMPHMKTSVKHKHESVHYHTGCPKPYQACTHTKTHY